MNGQFDAKKTVIIGRSGLPGWNVRMPLDYKVVRPERTTNIDRELQKYNIDIAALGETRISGDGS